MDKEYWEEYYKNDENLTGERSPSNFAVFCNDEFFSENDVIVDLGAGSGRDSLYFVHLGHTVYSLDQCESPSDLKDSLIAEDIEDRLQMIIGDFVNYDYSLLPHVDVFYSRFTLHAIKLAEENVILSKVFDKLKLGGRICIEARTIKDDLFGVGQHICDTTYMTDHCRRFIDTHNFISKLLKLGFELEFFHESKGFSRQKDNDPHLMRVIAQKVK